MAELFAAIAEMLGALAPKSPVGRGIVASVSALVLLAAVVLGGLELLAWLGY